MKPILLLFFLVFFSIKSYAQVGINTTTPEASSALDIPSTNKGILLPRMTSTQRENIMSPADGLIVYDTTTNSFWYYNNSIWRNLVDRTDNLGNHIATQNIQLDNNYLSNDGDNEGIKINANGNVGISTTSFLDKLNLSTGGIRFTNSEISNTSNTSGVLLFDENYYPAGEAGYPFFTNNGGGLAIKNEDGWGALISTANMEFLNLDINSLALEDKLTTNALKIKGGSPGVGKYLMYDTDGFASWKDPSFLFPEFFYATFKTNTVTSVNDGTWKTVAFIDQFVSINNLLSIKALAHAMWDDGSGLDPLAMKVEIVGSSSLPSSCSGLFLTLEVYNLTADPERSHHNYWKQYHYLEFWKATCSGAITVRLKMRATGSANDNLLISDVFLDTSFMYKN